MSAKENDLYRRALDFLYKRTNYETFRKIPYEEMRANLLRLKDFLAFLGNPEKNFKIVHVAGTKGKGTVCASLDALLRARGRRVGLFTSPHIEELTERFQINGKRCGKTFFAETLLELARLYARFEKERGDSRPLTFFEWSLVVALVLFARAEVDVAILEVGLGGKFDATNVCDADVCAITSVSYDHCDVLGSTLEEIAGEKAGIIKSSAPVVCGVGFSQLLNARVVRLPGSAAARSIEPETTISDADVEAIRAVVRRRAEEFDAPFHQVESISLEVATLPSPPFDDSRRWNFEIALKILDVLEPSAPAFSPETLRQAATQIVLPCRFEQVSQSPAAYVDGAHNRASVAAFVQAALERFPNRKIKILFASTVGKDVRGMLAEAAPFVDEILLTERSQEPRALPIDELIRVAESVLEEGFAEDDPTRRKIRVVPDFRAYLADYFARAPRPNEVLCAVGSFYFAAAVKAAAQNARR
ncbi:MAG: hypothetical protein IKU86_08170 [Thermoguttaceae bacterium]|nr:hypothetical protein [Thermoguttaceae bacterium]